MFNYHSFLARAFVNAYFSVQPFDSWCITFRPLLWLDWSPMSIMLNTDVIVPQLSHSYSSSPRLVAVSVCLGESSVIMWELPPVFILFCLRLLFQKEKRSVQPRFYNSFALVFFKKWSLLVGFYRPVYCTRSVASGRFTHSQLFPPVQNIPKVKFVFKVYTNVLSTSLQKIKMGTLCSSFHNRSYLFISVFLSIL